MRIILSVLAVCSIVLIAACSASREVPQSRVSISVSAQEFKNEIDKNDPGTVLIDIRTPQEFAEGHIPGALNLDFYASGFEAELNAMDKTKTYLIYCRSGNRTGQALALMNRLGFSKVINLQKGIIDWTGNMFAIEK